jgi:hypothetical protein
MKKALMIALSVAGLGKLAAVSGDSLAVIPKVAEKAVPVFEHFSSMIN